MSSIPFRLSIPVIWKELLQIGTRRQIFAARTTYAGFLFLSFAVFVFFHLGYAPGTDPFTVLGRGRDLFNFLVYFQFAAIYLFLPALMAGSVAGERSRGSLSRAMTRKRV